MDFKKLKLILSYALLSGITFTSCTNEENIDTPENTSITEETRYANKFAKEVLELYYYWNEEISKDLNKLDPEKNSDPISTVEEIRYHDGTNQVDKWTMLTNNMDEFTSSVDGVSTTYGYTPMVYLLREGSNEVIAAVAFVSENKNHENCVRTIYETSLTIDALNPSKIHIYFKGSGFLKYQIRNMVGTLIRIGEGKMEPERMLAILESKDRMKAGRTAPACGLYLVKVNYKV